MERSLTMLIVSGNVFVCARKQDRALAACNVAVLFTIVRVCANGFNKVQRATHVIERPSAT